MSGERHVVVGVGNRFRRDDSAGLYVAERLQDRVPERSGDPHARGRADHAAGCLRQRGAGDTRGRGGNREPFPG